MQEVLDTANYVAKRSRQVTINLRALRRFCRKILQNGIQLFPWDPSYHFCDDSEDTVFYLLILDSLNFCFWPPAGRDKWKIEYKGEVLSGYIALAASIKRAMESGIPLARADYLSAISAEQLKNILGGSGYLQLVEARADILNELGNTLIEEYEGLAHRLVESAGKSTSCLARLLAEKLDSFKDTANYEGRRIFFFKRAQILAADLWGAFKGRLWGEFKDMDKLTAFADYKLPQVMRHLQILRYAPSLGERVDKGDLLDPGSPEEIEIRANTILAVELIRQQLELNGHSLMAFQIDWMLWNLGQQKAFRNKPYHRTVTIFY